MELVKSHVTLSGDNKIIDEQVSHACLCVRSFVDSKLLRPSRGTASLIFIDFPNSNTRSFELKQKKYCVDCYLGITKISRCKSVANVYFKSLLSITLIPNLFI